MAETKRRRAPAPVLEGRALELLAGAAIAIGSTTVRVEGEAAVRTVAALPDAWVRSYVYAPSAELHRHGWFVSENATAPVFCVSVDASWYRPATEAEIAAEQARLAAAADRSAA